MPMPKMHQFCVSGSLEPYHDICNSSTTPTIDIAQNPTQASRMMLYVPFGIPFSFSWPLICASRLTAGGATFSSRLATTCDVASGALGGALLGFRGESSPELDRLRVSERLGRYGIGVEGLDERNYIGALAKRSTRSNLECAYR